MGVAAGDFLCCSCWSSTVHNSRRHFVTGLRMFIAFDRDLFAVCVNFLFLPVHKRKIQCVAVHLQATPLSRLYKKVTFRRLLLPCWVSGVAKLFYTRGLFKHLSFQSPSSHWNWQPFGAERGIQVQGFVSTKQH